MIKGKKGFIDDMMDLLIMVVVSLFIFLLVYYPISTANEEADNFALEKMEVLGMKENLLTFLNIPVEIDGEQTTMGELAATIDEGEEERIKIFKERAEEYFGEIYLHSPDHPDYEEQKEKKMSDGFIWWLRVYEKEELIVEKYFANCDGGDVVKVELASDREIRFCLVQLKAVI